MRWIAMIMLVCSPLLGEAADLDTLARYGYVVVKETQVDGSFEGCDFDRLIPLTNGLVFKCSEYSYTYSFMPEVIILKHVERGDVKVIINSREYRGQLYRR